MTEVLTPAQARVWHYIADHVLRHGYSPTLREMCVEMGIRSTNGISDHVRALRRKGYVKPSVGDETSRTITLARWPAVDVNAYGSDSFLHGLLEAFRVPPPPGEP